MIDIFLSAFILRVDIAWLFLTTQFCLGQLKQLTSPVVCLVMTETHPCNCHKQTKETVTFMIVFLSSQRCTKKPVFDILHNICKRSHSLLGLTRSKIEPARGIEPGIPQSRV